MKELRVQVGGHPFRTFFAFDQTRKAIVLCAGDKKGEDEKLFYERMIKIADAEFTSHLISPESRARIEARTAEIRQEITLAKLREELNMSQTQLALALGGKLTLDVTLPDGKRIALTL
ncbi:hypothetical protein PEC301875_27180 [Pectobacterium carotovorum subsp. carotovorum]|nr:hypothetical protein PEC301875_27180 [Pectobacterium carotovorum subsp. carotovorum]